MSSTTPPPPKQGSGPFIIAALVMLLLMGGLIYWKTSGDDDAPAPVAPVNTGTPTPQVFEEPPPPPPPPEEQKDAGVEPKQPSRRVASGVTGTGCNGECKGEMTSALRGQLAAKGSQARGCYERALRQNAQLQGRMKVSLRVGGGGNVCSASVTTNELGDPGIASCVVQIFRGSSFPAPQGGCIDAEVPLRFEPKT